MKEFVRRRMPPALFGGLLIDLEDSVRAGALKAHTVKDHFKLSPKRTRELEGQTRFRLMEEGFEEVCKLHGGIPLLGGIIPLTNLKIFQPFSRFEHEGQGFILGLAAIPEPVSLPAKNMSRRAGVSLNYSLSPRLPFEEGGLKIGDIFILFLVSRDRRSAGQIEEIAIGIVDSSYESYLHYETLHSYLQGYGDSPAITPNGPIGPLPTTLRLKGEITPFVPQEVSEVKENTVNKKE